MSNFRGKPIAPGRSRVHLRPQRRHGDCSRDLVSEATVSVRGRNGGRYVRASEEDGEGERLLRGNHGPECDVPPHSHTDGQVIVRLRASVIVTLALLLSVATTYAQSMYLLWSHFTLRDGEHWQVHYAFESKKECKSAAAAVLREAARRGNTVAGDRVTTASGDLAPVCLPDTADPRGVKGK